MSGQNVVELKTGGARVIDAPTINITRGLYDLWLLGKGGDAMPRRRALSIGHLGELMPFVYVYDVLEGGADFRVRFMGSSIVHSLGRDYTGVCMSDNAEHKANWRADVYREVCATLSPFFSQVSLDDFDRGHVLTESIILPLADNDGDFNMLICAAGLVP